MKDKELLAKLKEDAGSEEESAELLPLVRGLQEWQAPVPTASETSQLAESMRRLVEARRRGRTASRLSMGWLVLCSQVRVVQGEIWAASAIVMGLGLLVTLGYSLSQSPEASLPLVLMAPLAAASGIALLYGPSVDPALEIELTLPVSPRQILVGRLVLVFGFNLALGLAGSAALSVLRADVPFLPLVSAWLAPMTFLAALAFLLMTLTLDSGVSLLVCLGLWLLQNIGRLIPDLHLPFPIPDMTAAATRPWLWLLTFLLIAAALWLGRSEEHWLRKQA